MSTDNNKSEVEHAAEEVNPSEVKENLQQNNVNTDDKQAENLSEDEKTPFIEDELRTDK